MTAAVSKYTRILLKLSGEALMGNDAYGINPQVITDICREVKAVAELGVEIGVVIGASRQSLEAPESLLANVEKHECRKS